MPAVITAFPVTCAVVVSAFRLWHLRSGCDSKLSRKARQSNRSMMFAKLSREDNRHLASGAAEGLEQGGAVATILLLSDWHPTRLAKKGQTMGQRDEAMTLL